MPSKNSINKPKQGINNAKKHASVSKKRSARIRSGIVPRASRSDEPPTSTAVALYNGEKPTTRLTTQTLSKKRLNKIERNKRYIKQRKELEEKILIDATAQSEEAMDIDQEKQTSSKKAKKQSKIDDVKQALLSVLEDAASGAFVVQSNGEGTTLGSQSFI